MQLDRVLRDKTARLADPDLGHGDIAGPLRGVGLVDHHCRQHRHAASLLQGYQHLCSAVLEHLVLPDRLTELLAGLQVFEGHCVHRFHRPDRLGRGRGDPGLDHALDDRQRLAGLAQYIIAADFDPAKRDLRRPGFVAHRVGAARHTVRLGIDQE